MIHTIRKRAMHRGRDFIYQTACKPKNFRGYGFDYLGCFHCLASISKDRKLRPNFSSVLKSANDRAAQDLPFSHVVVDETRAIVGRDRVAAGEFDLRQRGTVCVTVPRDGVSELSHGL